MVKIIKQRGTAFSLPWPLGILTSPTHHDPSLRNFGALFHKITYDSNFLILTACRSLITGMSSTPETNASCSGIESAKNMSTSGVEDGQAAGGLRIQPRKEKTTFENLPSELRSQILCSIGDLRTLRLLVRSSPTYHEQYRLDRDNILKHCLESELDGFYIDAFATLRSRVRKLGQKRTNEIVTSFLGSYRQWLSGPRDSLAAASNAMSISCADIHWLCSFHLSVAVPLAEFFCHWAYTNLTRAAASSKNAIQDEPTATQRMDLSLISKSERIRIMRAVYRCETYYHLFGRNKGNRFGGFRDSEIAEIFFNIFQPWEAEEIGCIDLFIQTEYTHVFNEVKADLHPDSSRFDDQRGGRGPEPDGSYELDIFWDGELSPNAPSPLGDSKYSFSY